MNLPTTCYLKKQPILFSISNSISQANQSGLVEQTFTSNIYPSQPYLAAIEGALTPNTQFRYVSFFIEGGKKIGLAIFQITLFQGSNKKHQKELSYIGQKIKDHFISVAGFYVLTCGNAYACGENGFAFDASIPLNTQVKLVHKAAKEIAKEEVNGERISILLFKEYWPISEDKTIHFKDHKYAEFNADVNMVLPINVNWTNFDDYLADMQAKFRTKANAAIKRSAKIVMKSLSAEEIASYNTKIETLYHQVLAKSPYLFGHFDCKAFTAFKKNLGDKFIFNAYFLDEELVSFSTAIVDHDCIDANYVGINYHLNLEYALYSRMLYDFVQLAINGKAKSLRLGRTAEEIKSSIGAEPIPMHLYARHRNKLTNQLIKPILADIQPSTFELRRPFKSTSK